MFSHTSFRFPLTLVAAIAILSTVGLAALIGPPSADAQRKKVLNIAAKEPDSLDPHASTLGQSQAIARFMFRGLTRFAIKDGKVTTAEVEPDLAESWTLSPEGTIWTFKLKKGVQFHKGFGELTAEDVKFSFERQINRGPGLRFGVNLEVIKSIEVVNPHTVQIALKSFDPIFLLRMVGYQQGYIISKKAAEKYGEQFKWNPVGTGPFYFDRHSPREKVVLKAFDKFYGGRPQIDEINYFDVPEDATKLIGLEKGTFDLLYPEAVTADFADQVKKMGAVIDRRGPGQQERFYINMTKPPFDDIRVRKAFMHAIDRKAIKETMYPGDLAKVATSCVPPGYFGHVPMQFPEHNPELAKKLLAEAGYPSGFDAGDYTCDSTFTSLGDAVVNYLRAVGIRARLRPLERAAFLGQWQERKLRGLVQGANSSFGNAVTRIERNMLSSGTFASYPEIDDLFQQQTREPDRARREALVHAIQRIAYERAMFVPIFQLAQLNGVRARVAQPGIGLIEHLPYSSPYEDLRVKP